MNLAGIALVLIVGLVFGWQAALVCAAGVVVGRVVLR